MLRTYLIIGVSLAIAIASFGVGWKARDKDYKNYRLEVELEKSKYELQVSEKYRKKEKEYNKLLLEIKSNQEKQNENIEIMYRSNTNAINRVRNTITSQTNKLSETQFDKTEATRVLSIYGEIIGMCVRRYTEVGKYADELEVYTDNTEKVLEVLTKE